MLNDNFVYFDCPNCIGCNDCPFQDGCEEQDDDEMYEGN